MESPINLIMKKVMALQEGVNSAINQKANNDGDLCISFTVTTASA